MGIKEYIKEWWGELWNSDSSAWQVVDRILFILIPIILFTLIIIPKDSISQLWRDTVTNLSWIIPLSIWVIFLLIIVPFRLASKYKKQLIEVNAKLNNKLVIQPLQNRSELIKAMAEAKMATIQFIEYELAINKTDSQKLTPSVYDKAQEFINRYQSSLELLEKETLVAGISYETPINVFGLFIYSGVASLNTSENEDQVNLFKPLLESSLKTTIKQLDDINSQVLV